MQNRTTSETSNKQVTLHPEEKFENTYNLDLSNLDGLQNMDRATIKKTQLIIQALLATHDSHLLIHQQDYMRNAVDNVIMLAAAIICDLCSIENDVVSQEHKKHVLNEFRNSMLHHYRKNPLILKNDKTRFLTLISSQFTGIFLRTFPVVHTSIAEQIINKIINNLIVIVKKNEKNEVILKLIDLIKNELNLFVQRYPDIYALYEKCNHKFCQNNNTKDEILELENEVRKYIADVIPQQCMNIMACFYDKSVVTNLMLMMDDEVNGKKYRKKIIDNYKDARRCWPNYYPQINVLYNAKIYLHEVDTELNDLVKKIRFGLINAKKKAGKISSLNEAISKNIELYIGYFIYKQKPIMSIASSYQQSLSLSENILKLITEYLNISEIRENPKFTINCCQVIEQLLISCEFELRFPDMFLYIMRETISMKLQAFRTVMDGLKAKDNDLAVGELRLFIAQYGHQYTAGTDYLNGYHDYTTAKDTHLAEVLEHLYHYYHENGRDEKAESYIDQGMTFLPGEPRFLQKKIEIEEKVLEDIKVKIIERSAIESAQLNLYIETVDNKSDELIVPNLINNTNKNGKIVSEYTKLISLHKNVVTQYANVENDKKSLNINISKYHNALKPFKDYTTLDTSNFADIKMDVLQAHLKKISLLKSRQNETTICYNKCHAAYKKTMKSIEAYEKALLDFKNKESEFNSLVMQEMARALRIKIVKNEKAAEKAAEKARQKAEEARVVVKDEITTRKDEEKGVVSKEKITTRTENHAEQPVDAKTNVIRQSDTIQIEIDAVTDDILLNGAGNPVSANVLNHLAEFDKTLRSNKSLLVGGGSFMERICIHYFNDNKKIAKLFPVNDIDLSIPFHPEANLQEIKNILKQFGFETESNEDSSGFHPYVNYVKVVDGVKIDLTLIVSPTYCSFDPIILRKGKMEFCDFESDAEYKEAIGNGRNIVKANNKFFEIKLPDGYENEFINACKFKEFSMLKPDTMFRGYSFGIYKLASKLFKCGVLEDLENETPLSAKVIYYHECLDKLIEYYDEQLQIQTTSCYLELNEFIKNRNGINPETQHLAVPFISAFYYSLINNQINQWTQLYHFKNPWTEDDVSNMSDRCADIFLYTYCDVTCEGQPEIEFDLKQETQNILNQVINEFQMMLYQSQYQYQYSSQYAYQGTLYPSNQYNNYHPDLDHAEDQQYQSDGSFTNGFSRGGFN